MTFLTKSISIPLGASSSTVLSKICKTVKLRQSDILSYRLRKQSVDARNKADVRFVCSFVVETSKAPQNCVPYTEPNDVLLNPQKVLSNKKIIVIGAGPCGLFSALYLSKCGLDVTVVEKGSDVEKRVQKVNAFLNGGELDEQCNVQFGLGGAGTFSDGKLTNGASSSYAFGVFKQFVRSGAPISILTDALPHIGTDNLRQVVANLRNEITHNGGKFLFDTNVVDILVKNAKAYGVAIENANGTQELFADSIVLACGHSARDVFHNLVKHNAKVEFKPFAVGLRVEHTREFINKAQYGELFATHRDLGAASYKLVNQCADGHGCYSFCMCPGGIVVPSASQKGTVVVNGMSNYARDDENSNSALVVAVSQQDIASYGYGYGVFAGVDFQQDLERKAFALGGGNYVAPCQNVTDFKSGVVSTKFDVMPSYSRGVKSANLFGLFPKQIADDIAMSLEAFDRRIKGFGSCGVLTGVETRTSSPVRIIRNDNFESNISNLYPSGEGVGYAGGIVSASIDGLRVAVTLVEKLKKS